MTAPEVLDLLRRGLTCPNCSLYSWEQDPSIPSSLTRCSNCRTLHYCSKECQEEHWVKVHKDQCKDLVPRSQPFLLCSKELVNQISYQHIDMDLHDSRWCSMCKKEEGEHVDKPDSPSYGCPVSYAMAHWVEGPATIPWGANDPREDIRTKLPFEVYELKDLKSGCEKVVWILQALLYKMKVTKYPFAKIKDRKAVEQLKDILMFARVKSWSVYMRTPDKSGNKLEFEASRAVVDELGRRNYQSIMMDVRVRQRSEDPFNLWEMFKLLSEFILSTDMSAHELATLDKLSLEDFPAEYRHVVENARQTNILQIRNTVVDALATNLVPFMKVVELFCGSLQQQCSNCKEDIVIAAVSGNGDNHSVPSVPFVTNSIVRKFSCAKKSCSKIVLEERKKEFRVLNTLTRAVNAKYAGHVCDFCFKVGKTAHRCGGCKTKIYCGKQCLEEDWAMVHRKVCARSKEEARKIKEGARGRKEEGGRRLEAWIDCHQRAFGDESIMDKVVDKLEKM